MSNLVSRFPRFPGADDASTRRMWAAVVTIVVVAAVVVAWGLIGANGWLESVLFEE